MPATSRAGFLSAAIRATGWLGAAEVIVYFATLCEQMRGPASAAALKNL
jgi:hypothetical protein